MGGLWSLVVSGNVSQLKTWSPRSINVVRRALCARKRMEGAQSDGKSVSRESGVYTV